MKDEHTKEEWIEILNKLATQDLFDLDYNSETACIKLLGYEGVS